MARNYEFVKTVEESNGDNNYWVSICHVSFDHDVLIYFGKGHDEYVREYYRIHYSWKNKKRNMTNLTFGATKTLDEATKLMEKKIKELKEKIR